jgi:hypothetical protein
MKKFFPLCLLLIVALVWTVSIASSFDRTPTASSDEKVFIEKPKSTVEKPVVQKQVQKRIVRDVPRRTEPIDFFDGVPTATSQEAEEAARVAGERAGEITVVPIEMGQRSASAKRMKEIKADGVISSDERSLYEELRSISAPGAELPMPLNIVSESEVNDSCQIADPVACGDTVWCATLTDGTDDEDWYTFTLTENQTVTIETHPTGTDCQDPSMGDTYLELWEAPCDSMIAYNDDIGGTPWNLFSRIIINLPPGTYAILSGNPWDETGSYHLSILCEDLVPEWYCAEDPPWYTVPPGKTGGGTGDIEPNDVCTQANMARCETAYCGVLGSSSDVDWYYIDLPVDTTFALHVRVLANDTPHQYAWLGGCDPWVGLYASDCATLVAANDDYYGTFPDAENFDSQIDPGYPNCFNPGERVYLEILTNYDAPGPYLLIINCVPCQMPQIGCDQDSLTIDLVTDDWPGETTWDVVDQSTSQIVCSGGPYANANTQYIEVCCLDSTGCYDFNIYDSYGDGGASYDLYFNDVLFYSSDGDYGFGESVQYIGNGCPEPTGACCVGLTCVATVTQDSCDALDGDWYIDEDCATFICPYGACCLPDGECTATTSERDCAALGGYWYQNETCPDFQCLVVTSCDTAIYHNGDPTGGAIGSQCARDYPFVGETADDFILPGAGLVNINEVVAWFWFWNPTVPYQHPGYFHGINVTVYANDIISLPYPAPGGKPVHPPDSLCSHMELIPNGIVYTTQLLPGEYTYVNEGDPMWRLMLPINVMLNAGEKYWLAVEPIMDFYNGGQCGWVPTDSVTGDTSVQIFEALGTTVWTPTGVDVAFCLIGAPVPWSCVEDPPVYQLPDNKLAGGVGDIEPNDSCTIAVEALCEYAYCGAIADSFDVDWYYIDLPPDNSYGVHVRVFGNDTPNQYAYGLGLDPLVTLYGPDCLPIMANDDYFGTFPDAEGYDSQLNPVYPNCFQGGTRVYISIETIYGLPGPYLLIVNCVQCVIPTGACCVEEVCVETNYEWECDALGGTWYQDETCPDFECPLTCLYAIYHNGDPTGGAVASQCARDYPFVAETADDFVLPGAITVDITDVIAWFWFWNPTVPDPGPAYYYGINVTFYANDLITLPYASPGGQPISPPDTACSHQENIPGGIIYTTQLLPTDYTYWDAGHPMYKLIMPIDTVTLIAGVTYWLGIQPIMDFFLGGQTGWTPTDSVHGYVAEQIFPLLGTTVWTPTADPERDMAFCLIAAGCDYVVGDVNGSNSHNGLDVTYGVNYFKGLGPDPVCPDCPPCASWYYCGDVNGSCSYNGLDITYNVNYFKGLGPDPVPCADCPLVGGPAADNRAPETPSVIKTKPVLEQKPGAK